MDIQHIQQGVIQRALAMVGDDTHKHSLMADEMQKCFAELNRRVVEDMERTRSVAADAFVRRSQGFIEEVVLGLIRSIQTMDQAIGHDRIHLAFDLFEGARALAEEPIHPCEELIALLGSICHDLGRYGEEKVFGKPMATQVHVWFSMQIVNDLRSQIFDHAPIGDIVFWDSVCSRVMGCVIAHFGPNDTTDPLRHFVQSCDRLADILGIRDFARKLACDMHLRGAQFRPDPQLNSAWEMAAFNNLPVEQFANAASMMHSPTNVIHYVEVPMRTMYPLVSPKMEERADRMKAQAARLLILLGGGINHETLSRERPLTLAEQLFAPELVAYDSVPEGRFGPSPSREKPSRWEKVNKSLSERVWHEVFWNKTYDHEDLKTMWPAIPQDVWPLMNWTIGSVWRFAAGDSRFRPQDVISQFLAMHAYTLPPEAREEIQMRVTGTDHDLAYGFSFAVAEAAVRSQQEREALQRLCEVREQYPLLACVAAAIIEEPIFHLDEKLPD